MNFLTFLGCQKMPLWSFPEEPGLGCQYLWAESRFCQTPGSLLRYIVLVVTPFSFPDKEKCPEQAVWGQQKSKGAAARRAWGDPLCQPAWDVCPAFSRRHHSSLVLAVCSLLLAWGHKSLLL